MDELKKCLKRIKERHYPPCYDPGQFEGHWEDIRHRDLKVWYGLRRTTETVVRKSIVIAYENYNLRKNGAFVRQKMHVVFERCQTDMEKTDSLMENRAFSFYEYFFDLKKYGGDHKNAIDQEITNSERHIDRETAEAIAKKMEEKIKELDYFAQGEQQPKKEQWK